MATEKDRVPPSSEASQALMSAGAVFLSYASEDAAAAERIATALRDAGIEVWFDKSELRGGDAWDRQIREQIHDCRLFIPVISANSERRDEGYFRREWSLAADRTRDMAHKRAFLVPVVIDATGERGASVPEKFHELQWTRLPGGETPPAFVDRVKKLLVPDGATRAAAPTASGSTVPPPASKPSWHPTWASNAVLWVISALLVMGLAYLIAARLWFPQHSQATPPSRKTASRTDATPSTADAFNPPPHSIAVLPFVNMSGDASQEYFSDGLSEELLNDLSRIHELQVAARTSAFSFKGKDTDIGTIARKLNVGAVLEGSVRRSAHTVRVTAQLINAVTGFHTWSQTYDRALSDMLKLQTEIAGAVASGLKVTLLGDIAAKIELGGTRNPAAFDAYLKGWKRFYEGGFFTPSVGDTRQAASTLFSEAVRLDPEYALAYMARSWCFSEYARVSATTPSMRDEFLNRALADAGKSIELAPSLGEGYGALAGVFEDRLEFRKAQKAYESSVALSPGSARVWRNYSEFYAAMGFADEAVTAARRAVTLDPLNPLSHCRLGETLQNVHRYDEALVALNECDALSVTRGAFATPRGLVLYEMGDYAAALASCEAGNRASPDTQWCLALVYNRLGNHSEAKAQLEKLKAAAGEAGAYGYAQIYAQWGERADALRWLEAALRRRDTDLIFVRQDSLLEPLRKEPRFQAIERALKFPD